jgi:hypothetical protein
MKDAMKAAMQDKRLVPLTKIDETTLRIDNKDHRRGFSPDSLRGAIVAPKCERPSDIIRRCRAIEQYDKA